MNYLSANQELLPLSHSAMAEFESFYALAAHQEITYQLKQFNDGEQILLYGETGAGCSHLAKATCLYHRGFQSLYLPLIELKYLDKRMLEGVGKVDLICVEDIDILGSDRDQQLVLFDLINWCSSFKTRLLLTTHINPKEMQGWLPDLITRLQLMLSWQVPVLSDDEKICAVTHWFKQQGMVVEEEMIQHVFKYVSRDLKVVKKTLEEFFKECMVNKKRPSISCLRGFKR